ncbi:SDR family NAD(P)-dependent oxidoreductase [Cnuibacter sp. UC19_7]|uniref:SDR family NAD(P)-dependent oxidoreductase n=1 Tax=Cnuibacter sp. UC19_7 TaxID=3350166 RepID=UPI00366C1DFB
MSRVPDLDGRCYVVTGGSGGLGYWASEQLAAAGATVVIATRDLERAEAAVRSIRSHVPDAPVDVLRLDLADLSSVAEAAEEIAALPRIDAIIANAGVLSTGGRQTSPDGFELMLGTNALGHAALFAHLMPTIRTRPGIRLVHLGSISHEFTRLDLDDLQSTDFREFRTYARSKLAVMTYAFELDRRLRREGVDAHSLVAHPGYAVDQLAPRRDIQPAPKTGTPFVRAALRVIAQGKHDGARPIVAAATHPDAQGGQYWGPDGWRQLRGAPALVAAKQYARDPETAARLWSEIERLTGVPHHLD